MKLAIIIATLLTLATAQKQRKRPNIKQKVFKKFQQYLDDKLRIEEESGLLNPSEIRISKIRNGMVKQFRNVTKLPPSMQQWYRNWRQTQLTRSCGTRTIGECNSFIPFDSIWDYGCWCYFGDDAGKGQGKAQNEVDELCKSLQTCYRCAKLDSLEDVSDKICKPGQIEYNVNVNSISNQGALLACQHPLNTDDCQIHVCSCEINFINRLLQLFFSGVTFNPDLHHDTWTQHKEVCVHDQNAGPSTMECCGSYPDRKPFRLESTTECCKDMRLYDSEKLYCCADGTVKKECKVFDDYEDLVERTILGAVQSAMNG